VANTSSRMLQLLSLLQTHRYWPGIELAGRLEVSIRTLRRDVDRLRELGYPVQAQRGVEGGYQLAAGASLPPLVLDDDEAVALALGLLSATRSPVTGMAESSVRALTKVVQVMPARLRRRVEALQTMTEPLTWAGTGAGEPTIEPDVLTTVAQACRDTERLTFAYTAADGAETERLTEPLRLVPYGRRWYLVAYDLTRHDWRSFRLDRLSRPRGTGARFAPRRLPSKDAAAFVQSQLRVLPVTGHVIDAVVGAPADRVRARIGRWASVEPIDSASCSVHLTTDSFEWPAMALGSLDAPFTVRAPAEFVDYVRAWGNRFAEAASELVD
jgi:predicted DNA-binding transcriptional regulator YafY